MRKLVYAVAALALWTSAPTIAQSSEEEILRMFIPREVSLVKDGDEYGFQSELGVPYYVFDEDEANKSNCTAECAETWWPVRPRGNADPMTPWTLVEREDGRPQWAYKGQPIYMYVDDQPGKALGDGIDGKWHVLKP